jgi:hypothetical protein
MCCWLFYGFDSRSLIIHTQNVTTLSAHFDEGSGTVAGDSSGYGNNGTNNYVEVPSSGILAPSNITIEFWVKVANPFYTAYKGFVCRNSRTNGLQVIKEWSSGRILARARVCFACFLDCVVKKSDKEIKIGNRIILFCWCS